MGKFFTAPQAIVHLNINSDFEIRGDEFIIKDKIDMIANFAPQAFLANVVLVKKTDELGQIFFAIKGQLSTAEGLGTAGGLICGIHYFTSTDPVAQTSQSYFGDTSVSNGAFAIDDDFRATGNPLVYTKRIMLTANTTIV